MPLKDGTAMLSYCLLLYTVDLFIALSIMWKAGAGRNVAANAQKDDDEWDTDPNFVVRRNLGYRYKTLW